MFDELRAAAADLWETFCLLSIRQQKLVVGLVFVLAVIGMIAWKVAIPLVLLAICVCLYLRRSDNQRLF